MKKMFLSAVWMVISGILSAQPASFSSRGPGGGGALFSPSINPADPNEYYIACDMTELFHSTDFGLSYAQVHFSEFTGGHNSKVCFTATSGLLFSISYINDVPNPVKSTDNGVTWNTLPGNPDPNEDIYTIHVNYNNPQQVIISDYSNIYFSSNAGTTFSTIHSALSGAGNVVAGVLFDGTNIYIGTNDGVLVSSNSGSTWSTATLTGLPANERIWSFAAAKSGIITRFFCLTGDVNDVYVGLQGSDYWGFMQGVYTCDYGVSNWTPVMTGITGNDYPMFVAMAENDINTVYLAGSNTSSEPIVMKTANAGAQWNHTFNTSGNANIITGWSGQGGDRPWSYGECPFGLAVSPADPNYVIIGDFGFPHITADGGANWKQAYVSSADQHAAGANTPSFASYHSIGIENTTCWQVHWSDANNMFACYSDIRGVRSTDSGNAWSFDYTGHNANSMYRIAEHSNGNLYAGTSNIHDMYQSTRLQDNVLDGTDANGKIIYSTNKGAGWQLIHQFNHPVYWVALDPNNTNRAYASVIHYNGGSGVGGIYRCDDLNNAGTSVWTLLPDPPRTEKHPASLVVLNDGTLVATYSGRRNGSGNFTASSGVFMYDPTSGNWTDVSHSGMYYWTKDVVIDPNDPTQNTWYVSVFSGWGGAPNGLGGLYKTINRGSSWTKLTGSILDRVTSCTFNPNDANEIYITTETQGLWMCSNINSGSPAFTNVSTYPFRQPERVFFNPFNANEIWVTSFGNGMKTGTLNTGSGIADFSNENTVHIYPNPASNTIRWVNESRETLPVEVFDVSGKSMLRTCAVPGNNVLDVSELAGGFYMFTCGNLSARLVIYR